jgi:hypothetical protein
MCTLGGGCVRAAVLAVHASVLTHLWCGRKVFIIAPRTYLGCSLQEIGLTVSFYQGEVRTESDMIPHTSYLIIKRWQTSYIYVKYCDLLNMYDPIVSRNWIFFWYVSTFYHTTVWLNNLGIVLLPPFLNRWRLKQKKLVHFKLNFLS